MEFNGVINVYKEPGYTSNDVVRILKRELKSKAGHTGTLDPQAEGVLPICLGRSTKLADYIMGQTKIYQAEIHFGVITDTQDMTGAVICDKRPVEINREDFQKAIQNFTGKISQVPPMYSAIKINGEKLYNLARKGIEVERKSREIEIFAIDIVDFSASVAVIDVECSKGTYIRSLCHDMGEFLGVGAAMGKLIRLKSGRFKAEHALTIERIKNFNDSGKLDPFIISPEDILLSYDEVSANEHAQKYIINGNPVYKKFLNKENLQAGEKYKLFDYKGNFIGLYVLSENGYLKAEVILTDLSKV